MLQICCKNNNIIKSFPIGSSLLDIYNGFNLDIPYGPVSAKVNNKVEGLNYRAYNNKDVEFLNILSSSGMRTYVRSLCFVLCKAVEDLYPDGSIVLEHPVSKGYYCDLHIGREIGLDDVQRIKKRMQEIIEEDIPFHRFECQTTEVVELFRKKGMMDKVKLLETSGNLYSFYYTLGDTIDYYYGSLLPSTGYIRLFDIVKYYDGLLLRVPNRQNPDKLEEVVKQEKMLDVFKEHRRWNQILGIGTVGDFNVVCNNGHATDLINVSEALQEKKISNIADEIYNRGKNGRVVKLILIYMDVSVTEEIKIRVVKWAKASVLKLSDGEPIFFWREALGLMLKGEFEIPSEKLLSLLCFGSYTISRKDFDEYYSREYSLFEYITERVDSVTLAPKVIEKLRANIDNAEYPLLYSFSNYIIENQIEEGYSLVLCFALSGYSLSANVMETLVKKGMKIEEIKKAASGLKVSDRLFCYSTLIRNTQESVWVRERLEGEYKSFNGYDLEHAVRLLISIGSMDALDYLVTRPEMIKYRDDYHFNYDNPNAISSLCYFIRYCYEHKIDGHFMLNSILNSLERIAIKSKDVLMEVTQYLRQLTQRGEMYKYLNRYIIGFEDKYYAAYSGISDINEAMRIADGGRLTKTEEEKAEEIPWREDEGIYISYNWEGHSAHIVDYLGFVLENRGIPFKLDKKDCPYTVNIKEFMNAIRAGKTVIVVLSRPYLRSKNCMYELSGIMENVNYEDRMLPVVVDDTIRDDDFYVELVKHWKEKKDKQTEIVEKLRDLDPDMAEPEEMKLKEIEQVYGLLKVIKEYIDWANADNLDALSSSRFKKIIDEIYKRRGIEHEDISG